FGETPRERQRKHAWLKRFQRDGCKLIDAVKDPFSKGTSEKAKLAVLRAQANALISEVRSFRPRQVVLIKVTVYDALYEPLRQVGIPVVNARLPFPGSGRQNEFYKDFLKCCTEGKIALPAR
ncbi:MAG: hypothetical protein OXC66_04555, partial [Roseovarius sp.]|nr:hypothetical protein [Roseovarius sp.]